MKTVLSDIADVQIRWLNEYGYLPEACELYKQYTDGNLIFFKDTEEDSLIEWFEAKNIM